MADKFDFSIPKEEKNKIRSSKAVLLILIFILASVAVNLVVTINSRRENKSLNSKGVLSAEAQKQLALKLEKQGLNVSAAENWKEYLAVAKLNSKDAANICYRIGTLYQASSQYEEALSYYYRSESFLRIKGLETEIGRRVRDCLESAGKFSALNYELAQRVDMNTSSNAAGDQIVAEIGQQKITKAELDRKIEMQIENQIRQYAAYLSEEKQKQQKQAMLKQLSSSLQRNRFLNQFIAEELLYRKAKESKLMDDPNIRAILKSNERRILAQKVLEQEMADQIKITPGDLRTWYEAHKEEYVEPEQVKISHIMTADEKSAATILERLKKGEDFSKLAKELSIDKTTGEKGGKISGWQKKGGHIQGIGFSSEANDLIFSTEPGQIGEKYIKTDKGFHIIKVREREPERRKTFDEVKPEVARALRTQKEKEVQQRLISTLESRYNVVIHTLVPRAEDEDTPSSP